MKFFTLLFATTVFATVSFAQIPITTVNVCPTPAIPGGPVCNPAAGGPVAPQPQLVPCVPTVNTLANTNWAFNTFGGGTGGRAQIGTFSVGNRGIVISGTMSTLEVSFRPFSGGALQRLASFTGSMDGLCLAGTNTLAAGTIQIADGLGGSILTWSYPITATIGLDRSITYAVTAVNSLIFSRYSALDPAGRFTNLTNGYGYNDTYATSGTANQLVSQLACPPGAESTVLSSLFGYSRAPGTQLNFTPGPGSVGTVTGRLIANNNNGGVTTNGNPFPTNPNGTEVGTYQVYPGCTGFTMNFPLIVGSLIIGSNFEGVFAAGDFSRLFILGLNQAGDGGTIFGAITLTRNTSAPVLDPFPPVPTGR